MGSMLLFTEETALITGSKEIDETPHLVQAWPSEGARRPCDLSCSSSQANSSRVTEAAAGYRTSIKTI
jgi:hypothetical protein